ncbi:MAG: acetylglutamate kinase [Treponema sp.]|jgi:acetylglutamate kinase|nr:acetylglutamate kinase [Treponema sp.]
MKQTTVIKYGGNAMINAELKAAVIEDVIHWSNEGARTVLVHGGGPEIDAMLKKLGKTSHFVNGLRYTDPETMEIVQMVLCGKLNKEITALIQTRGGKALGLCGIDGGLLRARRITTADLGLVGEITHVDAGLLDRILDSGLIPVVCSVALGIDADAGLSLNVNADTAAAQIAVAMKAQSLILMTDVPGLLRDVSNPDSLIREVSRSELARLKQDGIVSKGMIPKTDCCAMALDGGVAETHIIDGRLLHALRLVREIGTTIK